MTITSQFDFGSGPDPDLAYKWDTKRKLFSLAEACALPSAVLVFLHETAPAARMFWIDFDGHLI